MATAAEPGYATDSEPGYATDSEPGYASDAEPGYAPASVSRCNSSSSHCSSAWASDV